MRASGGPLWSSRARIRGPASDARPEEERYRRRITIEVPGLSPAAAAALGKIGRTSIYVPAVFEAVMAEAVAPPEQRAEIEAFAAAVARRFGATGGDRPFAGEGPRSGAGADEGGARDPGGRWVRRLLPQGGEPGSPDRPCPTPRA